MAISFLDVDTQVSQHNLLKEYSFPIELSWHPINNQLIIRVVNINKSTNKCRRGCGEKGTLVHCWWECRLVRPLWKTIWNFLRKLKMELPFDPVIPLLGLYPKNTDTPIQKNLCTPMFIAAQFTIAKYWKQPKSPSGNEWIKMCMVHLHNGILCSREKEGAYTLCNSMDETGEYYAK